MPIEIRELHIKINVSPEKEKPKSKRANSDGEMVQEVVEAVLETLERKKER